MGFPQRLLGEDERLVLLLRRHVKVLFGPTLVLLVTAVAGGLLAGVTPEGARPWAWWAIGIVAAVVLLRWTVWPFVVWWNTVYVLTTRRLILRSGVFSRSGHDMPLTRLNDVSFSHTLWQRMLGCGTLVVESGGERGQIELDDIPKVELVQRTLYRLSDEIRGLDGDGPDEIDEDLAEDLHEEFDEDYRGP